MFRNKLIALEHPAPESVDCSNRTQFANTILWLEDQKIRSYKIDDREKLRNIKNTSEWEEAYAQYKKDVGVPNSISQPQIPTSLPYTSAFNPLHPKKKARTISKSRGQELTGSLIQASQDLTQAISGSINAAPKSTANDAFGIFISAEIEKLDPDLQINAKKEIFGVVMDLQMQQNNRRQNK